MILLTLLNYMLSSLPLEVDIVEPNHLLVEQKFIQPPSIQSREVIRDYSRSITRIGTPQTLNNDDDPRSVTPKYSHGSNH